MKQNVKALLFAGAALSAVMVSCSRKEELPAHYTLIVNAGDAATKTVIDDKGNGSYGILWQAGDQLAALEMGDGSSVKSYDRVTSAPLVSGGETAQFSFSLSGLVNPPYRYNFVYPAAALAEDGEEYVVVLPSAQTFLPGSFDPQADVLVTGRMSFDARPTSVDARFARLGGTARMLIKAPSTTETIRSISFSTTEGVLAGEYPLDRLTGVIGTTPSSGSKEIVLTPSATTAYTGEIPVWFRLAALTLAHDFTVEVETDKNTYTKTVDLAAAGRTLQFTDSHLTTFNVNMTGVSGVPLYYTDVIDAAFTGVTSTSYKSWADKAGSASQAVYAGYTATRASGAIGLRTNIDYTNTYYSGIVSTTSGGFAKSVTLTVYADANYSRTVEVYAKNEPYASPNDLFTGTTGVLIGTVTADAHTENTATIDFPADVSYKYIGIRSQGYAVDVPLVKVTWARKSGGVVPPPPTPVTQYGWLELPGYSASALAGTTSSSLSDLYYVTHKAQMGGREQRNYTCLYDPEMYASYFVAYPLCKDHLSSGRNDVWGLFDPEVPTDKQVNLGKGYGVDRGSDYYARGHQIPNADRNGVAAMQEQTYYPTNITPQLQKSVNGNIWMYLEGGVREAVHAGDTVYVVTGASFRKKGGNEVIETIQPHNSLYNSNPITIPVPNYYWKVLLKVKWTGGDITDARAVGFWLDHFGTYSEDEYAYEAYATSVDQIEAWTGLDFFKNLPATLQTACESSSDWPAFKAY